MMIGDAKSRTLGPSLTVAATLAAVGAFVPLDSSLRFTLIAAMGWAIAAIGLDLLVGYSGQLSFGQAAFAGVGAYVMAALRIHMHLQWLPAALLGVGITALIAALLGSVMVRLPAFGSAIVSLFFGYVIVTVLNGDTLAKWFGGAPGLEVPEFPLTGAGDATKFYLAVCVLLALVVVATCFLAESQTGRALRMIKSDQVVAASCGVRVKLLKVFAFTYCCSLAAIGGIVYAAVVGYLGPVNFNINQSVLLFAMLVVGGAGTVGGPILGALVITVLPTYYLRSGAQSAIVFTAVLLVFLILLPDGVFGIALNGWRRAVQHRLSGWVPRLRPRVADVPTEPAADTGREARESHDGTAVLEVSELAVHFDGFVALSDVNVQIRPGSVHAIVGPNGAGKTTLLNTISGVYTPTQGDVRLFGESTRGLRPHEIRSRGVMRTFQNPTVVPDLSVLDNVKLGLDSDRRHLALLDLFGPLATVRAERRIARAAAAALLKVGIDPAKNEMPVKGLSLSEQKRVELARGLVGRGRVLLLDEPTAGLSVAEMDSLADTLRQVHEEYELTIVVISHHIGFVVAIADELTVLDHGRVIGNGVPAEVLQLPDVAESFVGIAAEEDVADSAAILETQS